MIAEIAVNPLKKPNGCASLIDSNLEFVVDTAKRIDEMPLAELEAKLPEFIERRSQNAFVLGGVLERIRREKFWNPGSTQPRNALFERWVEETCHYSGRKARYLIAVYIGLVQAAIPSTKVSDIGWSKLRMIAPLLKPAHGADAAATSENRSQNEKLLKLARRKSRRELEAALRAMSTPDEHAALDYGSARKPRPRQYAFKVHDGADVVDAALEKIAQETGHTGGAALVDMALAINSGGPRARSLSFEKI